MDDLYNRVARRRVRGQSGFTLIELLVVIAVLAVLALIVIFNVAGVFNRGASSACATDAKSVQTASDAYYNDNNQKYPSATDTSAGTVDLTKLVPVYLHTTPGNGEVFTFTNPNGTVGGQYKYQGALTPGAADPSCGSG
ncbi:MAG: type II secretion system protein [Candidatus Dormibacteria bacterium]